VRLECPRDLPTPALLTVRRPSRPSQPAPAGYKNPAYRPLLGWQAAVSAAFRAFFARAPGADGTRNSIGPDARDSQFTSPGLEIHFQIYFEMIGFFGPADS
jgi:hypothetical protein